MIRILCTLTLFLFCAMGIPESAMASKRFLDIKEVRSPDGITAWLVEDHSNPIISINFAFAGSGSSNDPDDKQGIAQLLSNTLDEGAGELDSQTFQKRLSDKSISLGFDTGRDDFFGKLKTLSHHQEDAFRLLRLALSKPRFDAEPLQRMKDANISRIRDSMSDPDWIAARLMNNAAYRGHIYARNSGGTIRDLQSISADDLRGFFRDNLTRDRLRVAVAGDITPEALSSALDLIFSELPKVSKSRSIEDIKIKGGSDIILMKQNIPQTIIQIIQDGISRRDPDWHAAQMMNFILGGSGFGSRLMEEVREKRGLTYGIYTGFVGLDHAPSMTVQTSTKNENVKEVLDLIRTEWLKMRNSDVTQEELKSTANYLIGSMPLSLTSTDSISEMMLSMKMDELPMDYLDTMDQKIRAVTVADIRRVSQRLLSPDNLLTILVGNPAEITPTTTVEKLPNVE